MGISFGFFRGLYNTKPALLRTVFGGRRAGFYFFLCKQKVHLAAYPAHAALAAACSSAVAYNPHFIVAYATSAKLIQAFTLQQKTV